MANFQTTSPYASLHVNGYQSNPSAPPLEGVPLNTFPQAPPYQVQAAYYPHSQVLYPTLNALNAPVPMETLYYPPSFTPTPLRPALTQRAYDQTWALMVTADTVVYSILGKSEEDSDSASIQLPKVQPQAAAAAAAAASAMPNINLDFSDKSWNMFNKGDVHHHYHEENNTHKEKDDTNQRLIIGLIGLVVVLVTAFFVGKATAEGEETQEESFAFEDLKDRWNTNKGCYDETYQVSMDNIVKRVDRILERRANNRIHKIALLVFGLIAGGTAVAGALLASQALMIASLALGTIVAAVTLFKLGQACFSKRDQKDATNIYRELQDLRAMPSPMITV